MNYPLRIIGIGRCLPERVVRNEEVEELCGLSPGSIEGTGAGVKERRWAQEETTRSMGAEAARLAVEDAGIQWDEVDLIISATAIQEQVLPDGAALIQRELGLGGSGIACMAIHTTCLGFLSALDVAGAFVSVGRHKTVVIINSEMPSEGLNFDQPSSAVLFGDAATAVVVRRTREGEGSRIEKVAFETYGEGADLTEVRGGGTRFHPNREKTSREDNLFDMDGEEVFWMSLHFFPGFMERFEPGLLGSPMEDIDWIVPHQASKAALDAFGRLGADKRKIITTIETLGNCVSASMPLTLHKGVFEMGIKRGERLLLVGTGAGLSFGAMTLIY